MEKLSLSIKERLIEIKQGLIEEFNEKGAFSILSEILKSEVLKCIVLYFANPFMILSILYNIIPLMYSIVLSLKYYLPLKDTFESLNSFIVQYSVVIIVIFLRNLLIHYARYNTLYFYNAFLKTMGTLLSIIIFLIIFTYSYLATIGLLSDGSVHLTGIINYISILPTNIFIIIACLLLAKVFIAIKISKIR